MFTYSLDSKPEITDNKGNIIKDLAKSMFSREAGQIYTYNVKRLSSRFEMRPDLVSYAEYGTDSQAELILKYTGISNPFSLKDDDVVMIPDVGEATARMAANNPEDAASSTSTSARDAAVRNYYKFVNQDYKSDSTSYDNLKNKVISSGVQTPDVLSGEYYVPYISEDDTAAVTIRNGRMYFGGDSGLVSANDTITAATTGLDEKIQSLIDATATALSDSNCIYNGVTLANFVRATVNSNQ